VGVFKRHTSLRHLRENFISEGVYILTNNIYENVNYIELSTQLKELLELNFKTHTDQADGIRLSGIEREQVTIKNKHRSHRSQQGQVTFMILFN
jgi:hypothetical protein